MNSQARQKGARGDTAMQDTKFAGQSSSQPRRLSPAETTSLSIKLRETYSPVINEPVPDDLMALVMMISGGK